MGERYTRAPGRFEHYPQRDLYSSAVQVVFDLTFALERGRAWSPPEISRPSKRVKSLGRLSLFLVPRRP